MDISYPQSNSIEAVEPLQDSTIIINTKSRLKKLSTKEKKHTHTNRSRDKHPYESYTSTEKKEETLNLDTMKAPQGHHQDSVDPKRKKPQQIARRNFQKALEEEEQMGLTRKKVKTLSDSETKTSSPTLSRKASEKESEFDTKKKLNDENLFQDSTSQSSTMKNLNDSTDNKGNTENSRNLCKNLSLFYSEDKKEIFFKVQYVEEKTEKLQEKILDRRQMVESNPLVVLYYYENHLQFAEDPGFRPKYLQKK